MIVVDTNVIAYLWLPGAQTAYAEALLQSDPDWAAPLLWRSEFRSVLAGLMRRRQVGMDAALAIAERAEAQLRGCELAVSAAAVLDRIVRSRCSAYDCEFVALADELGVPLVTTDRAILGAFPESAVPLREALR